MKQLRAKLMAVEMPKSTNQNISPSEPYDPLLTEKQAAPIVGFSVRTMQQRRYMGLAPNYVKLPGSCSIRYRLSDLLAYVEQGVKRPTEGIL